MMFVLNIRGGIDSINNVCMWILWGFFLSEIVKNKFLYLLEIFGFLEDVVFFN